MGKLSLATSFSKMEPISLDLKNILMLLFLVIQ